MSGSTATASYSVNGVVFEARQAENETCRIFQKTFLGWLQIGWAVSANADGEAPWDVYDRAAALLGEYDSLGGAMGRLAQQPGLENA